jgi:hypothetical protein
MRLRLVSMFLMFAILFGGLAAPETAHAEHLLAGEGIEVLDMHDHADGGNQRDPKQEGGSPCHALVHHHCGVALATDSHSVSLKIWDGKASITPLIVQPMRSLALAPPTEPPAA